MESIDIHVYCRELAKHGDSYRAYRTASGDYSNDYATAASIISDLNSNKEISGLVKSMRDSEDSLEEVDQQWIKGKLVQIVKRSMTEEPVLEEGVPIGLYQYNGGHALKALELLGRAEKMFTDKVEVNEISSIEELAEIAGD